MGLWYINKGNHSDLKCESKKGTGCDIQQWPFSQVLLDQIQKVRSVLKSAGSGDFKTVLTFDILPSRSWDIWG